MIAANDDDEGKVGSEKMSVDCSSAVPAHKRIAGRRMEEISTLILEAKGGQSD